MKRIIWLLVLLSSITSLNAINECDSLIKTLDVINNNREKYNVLIDLAHCLKDVNTKSAMQYTYQAIDCANELEDVVLSAESNTMMADLMYQTFTYATAIDYYTKAIEYNNMLHNYVAMSDLYIKMANTYQNGEFNGNWSIETMTKAIESAEKSKNNEAIIKVLLAFGKLYQDQGKLMEANEYYSKVIDFTIEKYSIRYIANALTNMAAIAIKHEDYQEALKMADSSLYLCIRDGYDEYIILNYGYKAEVCDSLKLIDEAETYYRQSLAIAQSLNDVKSCAKYCYALGSHYSMFNDKDKAIQLFVRVCDSAIKYKLYDDAQNSFRFLADHYAEKGDYKLAYDALCLYDAYHDSSFIDWQNKKIVQQKISYLLSLSIKEYNIKNKELNAIKQSERIKSLIFTFILTLLFVVLVCVIVFWRIYISKQKQKQELIRRQAELTETQANMMEMQLKINQDSLINIAFHLSSYINFIQNLKDDLKSLISLPQDKQSPKIKEILVNLQQNIKLHQNIEQLEVKINEAYKDFFQRLDDKYPDLTKSDRKLCVMLRMNMSTKEIAFLTNTSVRSVETGRYRLRKKFDIPSSENLIDFLQIL